MGATIVHEYRIKHSQDETIFTHMEAALAFKVSSDELGLKNRSD
jgi:hypothetical protein